MVGSPKAGDLSEHTQVSQGLFVLLPGLFHGWLAQSWGPLRAYAGQSGVICTSTGVISWLARTELEALTLILTLSYILS